MELKWKIGRVTSDKVTGLVVEAKYIFIASEENKRSLKSGKVLFTGDASSKSFIEFEKLTEEQVLSWVKSLLGDKVSSIEKLAVDELLLQIEKEKTITTTNKPLIKEKKEKISE